MKPSLDELIGRQWYSQFESKVGKHSTPPPGVDPKEIEMGIKVEMEHTKDPEVAKKIAYDHLYELPTYYTKLKAMEKNAKK